MDAGLSHLLTNIKSTGHKRPLALETWAMIAVLVAALAWVVVPL